MYQSWVLAAVQKAWVYKLGWLTSSANECVYDID